MQDQPFADCSARSDGRTNDRFAVCYNEVQYDTAAGRRKFTQRAGTAGGMLDRSDYIPTWQLSGHHTAEEASDDVVAQ
jgi:hypothetical protein